MFTAATDIPTIAMAVLARTKFRSSKRRGGTSGSRALTRCHHTNAAMATAPKAMISQMGRSKRSGPSPTGIAPHS